MAQRSVLILGANGRFGGAAASAFAAAGWRVMSQVRRAPKALPGGVEPLVIPLADTRALAQAAAGAAAVVYAVNPPYTDWAEQLLPLARQGMDVAERLGALFLLPGNIYGYGEGMPAVLSEETPERPSNAKGRLRVSLEAEMQARARAGKLRSIILRGGDFYGSGGGSWLDLSIVKSIRQGRLVYPGPLDLPHAWAYLPDLAAALVRLADRAVETEGPAFESLLFAGHTLTGAELLDLIEAIGDDLGLTPARGWRRGGMPWGIIRAMGVFAPMLRAVAEMSYLWRVPHRLDGARLTARLGPLPETAPPKALRQALIDLGLDADRPAAAALAQPSFS